MQLPKSSPNFNNRPVFLPILAIFILVFFVVLLSENGVVFAGWTSPVASPPGSNVPPPLNEDSNFLNGQVRGTFRSGLNLNMINNPNCTSSKSLIIGDNYDLVCSDPTFVAGLLEVLNNSSTAKSFEGEVVLGDMDQNPPGATWLDVAGAITGQWLHIIGEGANSIFGTLELGNDLKFNSGKSIAVNSSTADTTLYFGNYDDVLGFDFNNGLKANLQVEGKVNAGQLCIKGNCADDLSNIGIGVFKQLSANAFNGSVGGYDGANSKCPTDMHVCTAEEILNTINKSVVVNTTSTVWISAGPPGHISTGNDCKGWENNTGAYLGRIWNFNQKYGAMTTCNSSLKFACCQ